MTIVPRFAAIIGVLACLTAASVAQAQQEFPPPQGKGRVVVLGSGMSGPEHYTTVAREIAELGYDVVLFDGNTWEGTHGDGVKCPTLFPAKLRWLDFLSAAACLYITARNGPIK
jgi:hypothetical protein